MPCEPPPNLTCLPRTSACQNCYYHKVISFFFFKAWCKSFLTSGRGLWDHFPWREPWPGSVEVLPVYSSVFDAVGDSVAWLCEPSATHLDWSVGGRGWCLSLCLLQVRCWTRTCGTILACSSRRAPWTTSYSRWSGTTCTCAPFPVSTLIHLSSATRPQWLLLRSAMCVTWLVLVVSALCPNALPQTLLYGLVYYIYYICVFGMIQFEYLTLLVVHTKSFKDREQKGGGGEVRV